MTDPDDLLDNLLIAGRARLIDDLEMRLDLDAGLRALLPPERPAATLAPRPVMATSGSAGTATAECLRSLPPAERLCLRAHPAVLGLALVFRLDMLVSMCRGLTWFLQRDTALAIGQSLSVASDLVIDLDLDASRELAIELDNARDNALGVARRLALGRAARSRARRPARDLLLDLVVAQARLLDRAVEHVLDRMPANDQPIAQTFLSDLKRDRDLSRARDRSRALAQATTESRGSPRSGVYLQDLTSARNDFTDADLSRVSLLEVPLLGVRWSRSTRWPPGWDGLIELRSKEVAPGVFEVRNDGLAHIERALARAGS